MRDDDNAASISRLRNDPSMSHNPYLRQLRARWQLSQEELAGLLDISQARVSRYEQGSGYPPLAAVLALQVVFGKPPRSCFSDLYAVAEERVMTRAAALECVLRGKYDPASQRKRHLLESIVARATSEQGV